MKVIHARAPASAQVGGDDPRRATRDISERAPSSSLR
jgi:hypothetical protein